MKKEYWTMILAFFAGIVCANLVGVERLTSYGVLNEYFFEQLSSVTIQYRELLVQIILLRGKELILLILFSFLMKKVPVFEGCILFLLFAFGFLVTASIFNFGWKGSIVAAASLFPQWIFYGAALYVVVKGKKGIHETGGKFFHYQNHRAKYGMQIALCGILLLLFVGGVMTESYCNPKILKHLLKII